MKKKLMMVFVLALVALPACGGGGDGGGAPATTGTTLAAADAQTTSKAVSGVALAVLQQVGGAAPAGMVISKDAMQSIKDSGTLTATVNGGDGGSCSVSVSGTSSPSSEPMTIDVSGSIACTDFAGTVTIDGVSQSVTLSGSITASLSGSIAQDYSTIDIAYNLSWSDLAVTLGGTAYTQVAGDYRLTIVGTLGALTFTEAGTVGNQTVSSTYTFESSEEETPETPAAPEEPVATGDTEEEDPGTTIVATTIYAIFAQDNTFLGLINTNPYDSDSVCNAYGTYGSKYSSSSIWDKYASYGSDYASYSAFNEYTSTPPIIYSYDGSTLTPLYYLTTNTIKLPRIDSFSLMAYLMSEGCNISR